MNLLEPLSTSFPGCLKPRRQDQTVLACRLLLLACVFFAGCAVPVPPAGGPPDQDPPTLVSSDPEDGSVSQLTDRIIFEFDERIDVRSAAQAISIIPEFSSPLDVRANGNRITVAFPEALRENTTYIISLDTRFRDAHNVALNKPLTVAFGTGPNINQGRLRGNVLTALDGKPAAAIDIFAYAIDSTSAFSLESAPDYRTETDQQGSFSLSYLREASYFVLAVRDVNGNRLLDPIEATAVPPDAQLVADSTGSVIAEPWVLSLIDTDGPNLLQVRARTSRQLELRFSEPVVVGDTASNEWVMADSVSHVQQPVRLTYAGDNPRNVMLRIDSLSSRSHYLTGRATIADSSGNSMRADTLYFSPSSLPDEEDVSFLGFSPDSLSETGDGLFRIWPEIKVGLRFSAPPNFSEVEWIVVTDTSGLPYDFNPITRNGLLYELFGAEIDRPLTVTVQDSDSTRSRTFVRAESSSMGDLGGTVLAGANAENVIVELVGDDVTDPIIYTMMAEPDGNFLFTGLPGASRYFVRAFVDVNQDGSWSPGAVFPYSEAEPIGWSIVEEPVRPRWETIMPDTLFIIRE